MKKIESSKNIDAEKNVDAEKKRPCLSLFLKIVAVIVLFVILPCLFNLLFYSDKKQSHVYFLKDIITSSLSISDWFGFWITYISLLVTASLTYMAYRLSKKIENNQNTRQMENDKAKFIIINITSTKDRGFEITLPKDVISLNAHIISAHLKLGGGEEIKLEIDPNDQKELNKNKFVVTIPYEDAEKYDKPLTIWRQQMYNRRERYFIAEFNIEFDYELSSIEKKRGNFKTLNSFADVKLDMNEEYSVVNTRVVFKD